MLKSSPLIATATIAFVAAAAAPRGADGAPPPVRLSDEQTFTRSTHVERLGWARSAPSVHARRTTRLRRRTEHGSRETYVVLTSQVDDGGRLWVRIRIPGRPNGTTGWVLRDRLGRYRLVTTALEIDRARRTAVLRRAGRVVWRARVGVGSRHAPTPSGRFYVREVIRNLGGSPIYGPWAIGTSAYSRLSDWPGGGVVGVHGTDRPSLIPGRPSHGCIRLRNGDVVRFRRLISVGTPVHIR